MIIKEFIIIMQIIILIYYYSISIYLHNYLNASSLQLSSKMDA